MNFIGLVPETLKLLKEEVVKFKEENKHDPKIESNLTNLLGDLLVNQKIKMKFFNITSEILGITNPGDDIILKKKLSL